MANNRGTISQWLVLGILLIALVSGGMYWWYVYSSPRPKPQQPAAVVSPQATAQSLTWQERTAMSTARTEVSAAVLDNKIYAVGGLNGLSRTLATVEAYDPTADTWQRVPDLPEARHHTAVVTYAGKLYVIGGHEGISFTPKADVFIFDPTTNTWSTGTPLPEPRGAHGATVIGNSIYVTGGVTEQGVSNDTLRFNFITQQWEKLQSMPTAREHLAVGVVDSQLFVAGGRQGSPTTNMATLEVFDISTGQWSPGPDMPTARGGITGTTTNNLFIVSGGESTSRTFAEVEAYDSDTQQWNSLPLLPRSRHGLGSVIVNNTLYVIGGGQRPGLSVSGINESLPLTTQTQ